MSISIPLGREWTVTKQGRVRTEYHCEKCKLSTPVSLRAEGVGTGLNALFLDDEKAQREASAEATGTRFVHAASFSRRGKRPMSSFARRT